MIFTEGEVVWVRLGKVGIVGRVGNVRVQMEGLNSVWWGDVE